MSYQQAKGHMQRQQSGVFKVPANDATTPYKEIIIDEQETNSEESLVQIALDTGEKSRVTKKAFTPESLDQSLERQASQQLSQELGSLRGQRDL